MWLLSSLSCIFILVACNNSTHDNTSVKEPASKKDTIATHVASQEDHAKPVKDSIPFNIQIDTVIHFSFSSDSGIVTARGTLNKKSDPVICYLPVRKKKKLSAAIIPDDSNLNIRFSQIILPDSSSDGPFARNMTYKLQEPGIYKFIIGPNQMADGKRSGDFKLKFELKDY